MNQMACERKSNHYEQYEQTEETNLYPRVQTNVTRYIGYSYRCRSDLFRGQYGGEKPSESSTTRNGYHGGV